MLLEYAKAFLVGGLICAVGQVLIDYTKLTPARILVSYVVAGIVLGGLGKGVREAVGEHGLFGVLSGGVTAAAAGIAAAIFFALLAALIFKPGDKS